MTLLSYQVFQTVVEQGSFQKAAEILNLTPFLQSVMQSHRWSRNWDFPCLREIRLGLL